MGDCPTLSLSEAEDSSWNMEKPFDSLKEHGSTERCWPTSLAWEKVKIGWGGELFWITGSVFQRVKQREGRDLALLFLWGAEHGPAAGAHARTAGPWRCLARWTEPLHSWLLWLAAAPGPWLQDTVAWKWPHRPCSQTPGSHPPSGFVFQRIDKGGEGIQGVILGFSFSGNNIFFLCFAEERSLEPGSSSFFQMVERLNTTFFFPYQPLSSACVWQWAAKPQFCLLTVFPSVVKITFPAGQMYNFLKYPVHSGNVITLDAGPPTAHWTSNKWRWKSNTTHSPRFQNIWQKLLFYYFLKFPFLRYQMPI